jgi:hypothetical protein
MPAIFPPQNELLFEAWKGDYLNIAPRLDVASVRPLDILPQTDWSIPTSCFGGQI